ARKLVRDDVAVAQRLEIERRRSRRLNARDQYKRRRQEQPAHGAISREMGPAELTTLRFSYQARQQEIKEPFSRSTNPRLGRLSGVPERRAESQSESMSSCLGAYCAQCATYATCVVVRVVLRHFPAATAVLGLAGYWYLYTHQLVDRPIRADGVSYYQY